MNRIETKVEDTELFDKILNDITSKNDFINNSMAIVFKIKTAMENKSINDKQLAELLDYTDEDIEIIFSGFYNFDLQTITKIETVLQTKILNN